MKAILIDSAEVKEIDIENKLEALQEAVDGYIEPVTIAPGRAVMLVNEEGLLRGMGINLIATAFAGIQIVGPAIIVGVDGEDFTDVPEGIIRIIGLT